MNVDCTPSFEDDVRQYQERIYGFAISYLKNRSAAQDVMQEVLITFWEHYDDVADDRALPWLLRVTRNACIDALRKRSTRRDAVRVNTDGLRHAQSGARSPAEAAEAADFRRRIEDALDEIDEPYRSVIILREIQNLKYKEISEALDMPMGTVKAYVHRGRKKLRHQLTPRIQPEQVMTSDAHPQRAVASA